MKCPKCQTGNPEINKFCRECGTKLSLFCPQCSSENTPGNNFCNECGADGWMEKYEKEFALLL